MELKFKCMTKNMIILLLSLASFVSVYAQVLNVDDELTPEDLSENVQWLSGSWGVRLIVRGGSDLDKYVDDGHDYRAGAQEIVDNLPSVGHVITNFTNNAHAHLFTLRNNENVDSVMGKSGSIIYEEFVPSLEREQIIIDVINILKEGGKKVILYLNSQSIGNRSTEEGAAAWDAYVVKYFDGDEAEARLNLLEGYIKRFAEMGVDGYWLDAFEVRDDNTELINMIRKYNPNIAITTNVNKTYVPDLMVDTDGFDDEDETDYKVLHYACNDPYSDFSAGHIVPLAQKCPPGSWAYDEFTITDIEDSPVSLCEDSSRLGLKHMFTPIRATWSSERQDLMFDLEKTYRFIKRITEAGGAITFSTTTGDGTLSDDEMIIMEEVSRRMLMNPRPACIPYMRPPGAYLVGEERAHAILDPSNIWYHNNTPSESQATVSEVVSGVFNPSVTTPYTQGNASEYVSKFTRTSGSDAYIKFDLPVNISEPSYAKFKIRVFAAANSTLTNNNLKLVLRKNGNPDTELSVTHDVEQMNTWVDYTFDMSTLSFDEANYNEAYFYFASVDTDDDANGNIYYLDAFQGVGQLVSANFIINNSEGELLSDAQIKIESIEVNTNNEGEASFRLLEGEYSVNISKPDYLNKVCTVNLSSDSIIYIELESSTGIVEFHIMDGDEFVTNALVTLNGVNKRPNSLGVVLFEDVDKNTYSRYSITVGGLEDISSIFMFQNDTIINIQLDTTASLDKVKNDLLMIYPNPVDDFLTVEVESLFMNNYEIINIRGELVLLGTLIQGQNLIDVGSLMPGIYYFKVGPERKKIVVQ